MLKRETRQIAVALTRLDEASDRLSDAQQADAGDDVREELAGVLTMLDEARRQLADQVDDAGVEIADAAKMLGVSAPTARTWLKRGVLRPTGSSGQVERSSLAQIHRILSELRARGEDRNWLAKLVDYSHDLADRRSDSVRRGLEELRRGELESA